MLDICPSASEVGTVWTSRQELHGMALAEMDSQGFMPVWQNILAHTAPLVQPAVHPVQRHCTLHLLKVTLKLNWCPGVCCASGQARQLHWRPGVWIGLFQLLS